MKLTRYDLSAQDFSVLLLDDMSLSLLRVNKYDPYYEEVLKQSFLPRCKHIQIMLDMKPPLQPGRQPAIAFNRKRVLL